MPEIAFTQYLRPHGRPVEVKIDRSMEIYDKAQSLLRMGCQLEIEVLATPDNAVSMTVSDTEGTTIVSELVPNGPQVPGAIDRLITRGMALLHG